MISIVDVSCLGRLPGQNSRLFACASPSQLALMGTSPLFEGLSPAACEDIYSRARAKVFFRGETLFAQGDPVQKLVLLQAGRVKLTQVNADGSEVLLWVNGAGDALDVHGETAGRFHSCTARALERCPALVWDYNSLRALALEYPQINANITSILAKRLGEIEERFCELASREIPERLALLLLRLAGSVGKQTRAGVELELSRRELAQMTGTTLCTISRILCRWNELGWIITRRGGVVIANPEKLRDSFNTERPESQRDGMRRTREAN